MVVRMKSSAQQLLPVNEVQAQCLTKVEILFQEGKLNYRLLFGHPVEVCEKEFVFGRITRKTAYFKPGDVFAIDLWRRNRFGTSAWAVYVLQAAAPGEVAVPVPQVSPAAKVLLEAVGQERARQALRLIREIEERVDPSELPPSRFLLTDFRLKSCWRNKHKRRPYDAK